MTQRIKAVNEVSLDEYRKATRDSEKTKLEATLAYDLRAYGIPFQPHKRFHPTRKFEADFVLFDEMLIVEIEGGTYTHERAFELDADGNKTDRKRKSRHLTPTGFHNDCVKYNLATLLGFRILRFDAKMVTDGSAALTVKQFYDDFHGKDAHIAREVTRMMDESAGPDRADNVRYLHAYTMRGPIA